MTIYLVSCWERNSGFRYCGDKRFTSKRYAMTWAAQLARETAGATGYDVAVEAMSTSDSLPLVIARWHDGKRVTP